MSEENTTQTSEQAPEPAPTGQGPAELREAYNRTKEENQTLRKELMNTRLESIGLNADEGLGKAIAKEYSGEMTVEAIAQFAKDEYNFAGQQTAPVPQVQHTQRVEHMQAVGQPLPPNVPEGDPGLAALQERAANGDVQASITLKALAAQGIG